MIEDGLTYYWNPTRGGVGLIINEEGDYLVAGSSVSFEKLLEEYKNGERVKNIFTEFIAVVSEYVGAPNGDRVMYGANDGKIFKEAGSEGIADDKKIEAIKGIINDNLENIKSQCAKQVQNYKGGRQERLSIKINGDTYCLIGNTPDEEMRALYQQLKNEINRIVFE